MSLQNNFSKITVISITVLIIGIFSIIFSVSNKDSIDSNNIVPATRIAVIDSSKLKAEATCFKGHEKLEIMLSSIIAKMRNSEIKAKNDYEKAKNSKTLTKKQIARAIEKIEEDWNEISKQYKKEVDEIRKMDIKLSAILQEKLDNVIKEIANKYKIDIVFNNQIRETISVFYATKNVDITNVVIKRLNNVISHIDLEKLK